MQHWIELIRDKLTGWLTGFIKLLPNLMLAALVFTAFFFAARYLRRLSYKLLLRISEKPSISGLFSSLFYILLLFIGLFISLELLHLEKTISSLLAGAGIIGLALGFAFQDLTANFISGVFIIFRKPFEVGHIVETNGLLGTVEEIQLRSTTIRTMQGLHIMVPNKDIFQKAITNYSLSGERRIDIVLTLPAKSAVEQTEAAIRKALADMPGLGGKKNAEIRFTDYTGDTLKLEIWCWIDNNIPMGFTDARHRIIQKVYEAINPAEGSGGPA